MIADDEPTTRRLLGWIAAQRDLWRRIRYDAAPDELFYARLRDPRPPGFHDRRGLWANTARVLRGPMLRLVDVRRAFNDRREWGTTTPFAFSLELQDAQIGANNGRFTIEFDGTAAHVRAASRTERTSLMTGAPALAQLYAGEIDVTRATRMGLVEAEGDVAALSALFRPSSCFRLLDEF
jgi:hypothetical protein